MDDIRAYSSLPSCKYYTFFTATSADEGFLEGSKYSSLTSTIGNIPLVDYKLILACITPQTLDFDRAMGGPTHELRQPHALVLGSCMSTRQDHAYQED